MRAIISVVGKDTFGILAKVSGVCSENRANVEEVTQSVLQELFVMVMLVDISDAGCDFSMLKTSLEALAEELGMQIHVMHEDIFNSMHRI